MTTKYFKGWAVPGPLPESLATLQSSDAYTPSPQETLDSICGHYKIFQLKDGHRFSTDDVLTAWFGTMQCPSATKVLDLGSGIGTVALFSAWRLQGAHITTIEAQDVSIALARRSVALNGLTARFDLRHGDFRTPHILADHETFDLITGSPPYFPVGTGGMAEHPQKAACRFELRGDIADYCALAAPHLAPGGVFACVFPVSPPHQEQRVRQAAAQNGLTIIRERHVVLKEGEPPLLGLFAMMKSEHLPPNLRSLNWRDSDLVIRQKDGQTHPEYRVIKMSIGLPPT